MAFVATISAEETVIFLSMGGMPLVLLWLLVETMFLFCKRTLRVFYVLFVIGSLVNLRSVFNFGDMMILSMAFTNRLGCFLLSGKVAAALENYMQRSQANKMPVYR